MGGSASKTYVYTQDGIVGYASYHLSTKEKSYVDYSNAPAEWRLDTGNGLPQKMYFKKTKFDEKTRTFTGVIDWYSDAENTFGGAAECHYRMVFSADYGYIEGGEILDYDTNGTTLRTWAYGRDINYTWTA